MKLGTIREYQRQISNNFKKHFGSSQRFLGATEHILIENKK